MTISLGVSYPSGATIPTVTGDFTYHSTATNTNNHHLIWLTYTGDTGVFNGDDFFNSALDTADILLTVSNNGQFIGPRGMYETLDLTNNTFVLLSFNDTTGGGPAEIITHLRSNPLSFTIREFITELSAPQTNLNYTESTNNSSNIGVGAFGTSHLALRKTDSRSDTTYLLNNSWDETRIGDTDAEGHAYSMKFVGKNTPTTTETYALYMGTSTDREVLDFVPNVDVPVHMQGIHAFENTTNRDSVGCIIHENIQRNYPGHVPFNATQPSHITTKQYVDNSTNKTFIQPDQPTGAKDGDLWFNTVNNSLMVFVTPEGS